MLYYAFDLLFLDGFDLRAAPLIERRRVLAELLGPKPSGQIVLSAHRRRWERDLRARVRDGVGKYRLQTQGCAIPLWPQRPWLKVKCVKRDAFTIVGFVADKASVAALHLAKRRGKSLVYVGKAGTGFSRKVAHELYAILQPLAVDERPKEPRWIARRFGSHLNAAPTSSIAPSLAKGFYGMPRTKGSRGSPLYLGPGGSVADDGVVEVGRRRRTRSNRRGVAGDSHQIHGHC